MTEISDIVAYCDELLDVAAFQDYCPNGLQVEAKTEVGSLVSGVTASLALIEAAVAAKADAMLVHHGYFWRGEPAVLTGLKGRRIRRLFTQGINLMAYHLPLDAHPALGNNAQLGQRLGLVNSVQAPGEQGLVWVGETAQGPAADAFAAHIASVLGRRPLFVPAGDHPVHRLAWCTGGAQKYIELAAQLDVDAYLTGEVSEATVHVARESGVHFYAAGHHATERFGVQALGQAVATKFGLQYEFIDIENPA